MIPYIESGMDKSDNAEISNQSETCDELSQPNNQDEISVFSYIQRFLYDGKVYDSKLQS